MDTSDVLAVLPYEPQFPGTMKMPPFHTTAQSRVQRAATGAGENERGVGWKSRGGAQRRQGGPPRSGGRRPGTSRPSSSCPSSASQRTLASPPRCPTTQTTRGHLDLRPCLGATARAEFMDDGCRGVVRRRRRTTFEEPWPLAGSDAPSEEEGRRGALEDQ